MKIPYTINSNYYEEYEPSQASLGLVPESKRRIRSEDTHWDELQIPRLAELCLRVIVAGFETRLILNELPCWDRHTLLEILPTTLPLPLVVEYINDEIYWKRKVKDRWPEDANYCQDYGFDWKRMFLERHVQEAVEAMTPEGFDLEIVEGLCHLTKDYIKVLDLRQLQIRQTDVQVEDEDEFGVLPEPSDHIDLRPVIAGLENLTELHVRFGLRDVGSDYKKSLFQFSLQDCRHLGEGVAQAKNLKLLRVHSCNLDDDRTIALVSTMVGNESLETIDFSNCTIRDDGATAIAKFLRGGTKVKNVILRNNKIGESGMSALAFVLTQSDCAPVEYLNLKFNMFGDDGLKYLASALVRERVVINTLNLSCCDLGEESAILLAEVLNRNPILTNLDLSNNHLYERGGRALESAMERNKTIQNLDLRMTDISNEQMSNINGALYFNQIRALKGEKGVERELKLIEKRALDELERIEREAIAAAKAEEERELARRAEEAAKHADPDD